MLRGFLISSESQLFTSPLAGEVEARSASGEGDVSEACLDLMLCHPHPPLRGILSCQRENLLNFDANQAWFSKALGQREVDDTSKRGIIGRVVVHVLDLAPRGRPCYSDFAFSLSICLDRTRLPSKRIRPSAPVA